MHKHATEDTHRNTATDRMQISTYTCACIPTRVHTPVLTLMWFPLVLRSSHTLTIGCGTLGIPLANSTWSSGLSTHAPWDSHVARIPANSNGS